MSNEKIKVSIKDIPEVIEQLEEANKKIDELTAESTEWEERTYCWQDRAENLQIVLDKIKEEVLSELQMCKPKDMAISMEINYIEEKLERLLEEIE